MRARATTLPSSSAATALTDDVPMSIPTVTLEPDIGAGYASDRDHGVVQRPVRAHEAVAVHVGTAVDRAPPRARLLDDRHERGDVPQAHDRVDRDVDCAFRDEHVLPEVADAAEPPAAVGELQELVADPVGVEAFLGVPRERDLRVVERGHGRGSDGFAVAERSEPAARPPAAVQGGRRDDAEHELAGVLETDQRAPDRQAAHVALGPVDRVDDPTELGVGRGARIVPELLAQHRVTGRRRQAVADRPLHRMIGLADRREVGFGAHLQVGRRGSAPS